MTVLRNLLEILPKLEEAFQLQSMHITMLLVLMNREFCHRVKNLNRVTEGAQRKLETIQQQNPNVRKLKQLPNKEEE